MILTQPDMFHGMTKDELSIELVKAYEPSEGYIVAYSGGKDSDATIDIMERSGSKYEAEYYVSPLDPPELMQHIRDCHPEVRWVYNARGWWGMVVKRGLPRRQSRWCCEVIKESGGMGRVVVTGSRSGESGGRSGQKCFSKFKKQDKQILRPINNWSTAEVWEYIRKRNLPYCKLYDEGFERLGCVMCPLASHKNRMYEMERFPKIAANWKRACGRIVARRLASGKVYKKPFATEDELWDWWKSL